MEEELKEQLRSMGLLPASLDEEAQQFYREIGLDPSKAETHYTPGTPDNIIAQYEKISSAVETLQQMETERQANSSEFIGLLIENKKGLKQYLINHKKTAPDRNQMIDADSAEYTGLVKQIKEDLTQLRSMLANHRGLIIDNYPPTTGTGGRIRDIPLKVETHHTTLSGSYFMI